MIPFNHLGIVFNTFGSFIYPKSVRTALCKFLQPLPSQSKVLDIGAGTGILCQFGHECREDLSFVAVDPAEGMLKYSASYVKTYKAHAEALPFENDFFNVVLMGEALHHFSNIDESLYETARVLKKGGRLFIYDFNVDSFMGKSICIGEKLLGEPGNFFVPEILKSKLESYGFSVEIIHYGWRYIIVANI